MHLKPELEHRLERVLASVEQLLPPAAAPVDWARVWAANWRRHSFAGYLEAVPQLEATTLDDLVGIERQRQLVETNTRQFLAGYPANNVLLWGSRGTGKSSLVCALLNTYADQGLRIVQIDGRERLRQLPALAQQRGGVVAGRPASVRNRADQHGQPEERRGLHQRIRPGL